MQSEEVRIERKPITDANRGALMDGSAISEEEHEVTLHEERPVVEKKTVLVERVRVDKDTVTENVTANEEVRKETSTPTESTTPDAKPSSAQGPGHQPRALGMPVSTKGIGIPKPFTSRDHFNRQHDLVPEMADKELFSMR